MSESTFANPHNEQLHRVYGGYSQGLISLEALGDLDNAIYLCPADYAAFDAVVPGLFIILYRPRASLAGGDVSSQYAAYCAAISGKEGIQGLYTAYIVVDYKEKGSVSSPRTFKWHGDPGAILWKAQRLAIRQLSSLEPEPTHLRELMRVRRQLRELRDLQEAGGLEWKAQSKAFEARDPPGNGPSPAGPSNTSGQDNHARHGQPPPLLPSGNTGTAGQQSYTPLFRKTPSVQEDHSHTRGAKRKQDLNLGDIHQDTIHVAV